ncbi:MAG: lysozyme [Pseudomonadota bacterium]
MRVSERGLELIKSFEGFYSRAAALGGGRWVIGYGHTKAARAGLGILREEAEAVLRQYDLPPIEQRIAGAVHTPLNQNQFDALVSFAFNIGVSSFETSAVLAHLNAGEHLQAADAMGAWRVAELNNQTILIDALVRRRAAETALFLMPDGSRVTASSAKIRPLFDESRIPLSQLTVGIDTRNSVARAPSADNRRDQGAVEESPPNGLVPTASEDMALAVKERLVRILGEPPPPSPQDRERCIEDEVRPSVPTPDDITKAISAIADPEGLGSSAEFAGGGTHGKPDGRVAIDDLAPVEIDPVTVKVAMARAASDADFNDIGPVSYSFYGLIGAIGLFMGAFGLVDLVGALGSGAGVPPDSQYAGFGLSLLGALMILIAVYFVAKSLIIERR